MLFLAEIVDVRGDGWQTSISNVVHRERRDDGSAGSEKKRIPSLVGGLSGLFFMLLAFRVGEHAGSTGSQHLKGNSVSIVHIQPKGYFLRR